MKQTVSANLRDGEVYGGIVLGKNGERDYHLFAQTKFIESATFDEVKKYVEKVGGEGATRRDLALLRVNAPEPFGTKVFWSCEQPAAHSTFAWYQYFVNGNQDYDYKTNMLCGVAVRRLFIL
jgi:hypothetical protein